MSTQRTSAPLNPHLCPFRDSLPFACLNIGCFARTWFQRTVRGIRAFQRVVARWHRWRTRAAIRLQCFWRNITAHRVLELLKLQYNAAVSLQCWRRQICASRRVDGMRRNRAATRVQAQWRRRQAQTQYNRDLLLVRSGLTALQARCRGAFVRKLGRMRRRACLVLQTYWRRHYAQKTYQNYRRQMIKLVVG